MYCLRDTKYKLTPAETNVLRLTHRNALFAEAGGALLGGLAVLPLVRRVGYMTRVPILATAAFAGGQFMTMYQTTRSLNQLLQLRSPLADQLYYM